MRPDLPIQKPLTILIVHVQLPELICKCEQLADVSAYGGDDILQITAPQIQLQIYFSLFVYVVENGLGFLMFY